MRNFLWVLMAIFLTGCLDGNDANAQATDSVASGKKTFEENCVSCHGEGAKGLAKDWKKKNADGKFPAPPLNGTAHAWHHPPKGLLATINNGGVKLGGWMPGFKEQLNDAEKQGLLDYIHSLWPSELQQKYDSRFK
ncbi:MAG: cytochrome c [Candidatus Thioglobus sp.]|jgi:Cytochrome c, mono- and diheme variants